MYNNKYTLINVFNSTCCFFIIVIFTNNFWIKVQILCFFLSFFVCLFLFLVYWCEWKCYRIMFWLWFKFIDKISCTSIFYKNTPTTQRMNSGIHIFDVYLELTTAGGYIELFGLKNLWMWCESWSEHEWKYVEITFKQNGYIPHILS